MTTLAAVHRDQLDRRAYPFESRWCELPQGRMHYLDEGRGAPVVFSHGTPTWSFEWRHLIRELRTEYRCVAPDHLGFGLSERPEGFGYTPEAHAEAFSAFLDRLDLPAFTLVVHDFGGPIAVPYALAHPERIRGLVLVNTWLWSLRGDRSIERAAALAASPLGRFLYEYLNASPRLLMPSAYADRRRLTRDVHRHYLERFRDRRSRRDVLWTLARSLLGSSDHYEAIWQRRDVLRGVPTAIVWGTRDRALPPAALERLREGFPHAEVTAIDDAGHWPHEEQPQAVTEAVRALLRRATEDT
jgi:haloalkane dehalogenase